MAVEGQLHTLRKSVIHDPWLSTQSGPWWRTAYDLLNRRTADVFVSSPWRMHIF